VLSTLYSIFESLSNMGPNQALAIQKGADRGFFVFLISARGGNPVFVI